MLKILQQNKFIIGVFLVIIAFFFKKAPFYFFMPLPAAEFDTLAYFQIVEHLNKGLFVSFGILPPGFIMLCYFIGLFNDSLIAIVFVQDILYLVAFVFLLKTINKYLSQIFFPILFMLLIVLLNFYNLRYDTKLYPDFLYQISILYVVSFFIRALFSRTPKSLVLFVFFLIMPALIRSNGSYMYFLWVVLIIYLFANKEYKLATKYLVLPFLILQFVWAAFNAYTLNEFKPGYPTRILTAQKCKAETDEIIEYSKWQSIKKRFFTINHIRVKSFKGLVLHVAEEKENFYFKFLPGRYSSIYSFNTNNPNFSHRYRHHNLQNGSLMMMMTREFNHENIKTKAHENYSLFDHEQRRFHKNRFAALWLTSIYFFHNLYTLFFYNIFWLIWFMVIYISSIFILIKKRLKDNNALLVFSVASVHIFSILILTLIGAAGSSSLSRYIYVTDFIVFLTIGLSFLIIDYRVSIRKNQTL